MAICVATKVSQSKGQGKCQKHDELTSLKCAAGLPHVMARLTPKKSFNEYMNQTTTAHTPTRFQGRSTSPAGWIEPLICMAGWCDTGYCVPSTAGMQHHVGTPLP